MKPRWAIAGKEFRDIFKERTIVVAVLIQVFVAGLSSFLVVGLSAIADPSAIPSETQPTVAVAGPDDGVGTLMEHGLSGRVEPNASTALAAFAAGRADAALIVQNGTANGTAMHLRLVLPDGTLRATLTLSHVKEVLQKVEADLRDARSERLQFQPVRVDVETGSSSYEFAYSLLIPLLVFLPVVLAGALTADSLTEEIQRDTMTQLLASPATPADVVEGKVLANAAIAPILTVVWLALLLVNDLPVPLSGAAAITVFATAAAVLMCLLAALVGLLTRDRNQAQVLYTQGMLVILAASLLLPVSPVNAVALLAVGSATPMVWGLVAGTAVFAAAGLFGLRWVLARERTRWVLLGAAE